MKSMLKRKENTFKARCSSGIQPGGGKFKNLPWKRKGVGGHRF